MTLLYLFGVVLVIIWSILMVLLPVYVYCVHRHTLRSAKANEQIVASLAIVSNHLRMLRAEMADSVEPVRQDPTPVARPALARPPKPAAALAGSRTEAVPWKQFPPEAPPPGPGDLLR